ncbi:ArnT family glycosyltransferase [Haladaptatus cibarius]|uniref:ArnT family glycosyltransferase n=1 Tax=Haladaptatus cibarius TaxID=453847 RepID=UPI000678489F|nr:glycosyltransferase family 39 protein [Haladaptatus cibarius]
MSHGITERREWSLTAKLTELASDERAWLATAIGTALLVHFVYLTTHPYPAYGAGLYLQIAEEISAHGYGLPERIPLYTRDGIPFAYPPLMYYVSAVIMDVTGVDPITLSRLLPGFVTVLYLIPFYYLAREVLESTPRAGFATVVLAVTPPVLQWHLSAGGVVRAPAFLFALTGAYTGIRMFKTGETKWLVSSTVLFGMTILTHPVYTVFFGTTYLVMFACFSRTPRGLVRGAIVASGGILLASPWWLQIVATHGAGIFTAASGTHTGLGGGMGRLLNQFVYSLDPELPVIFFIGSFAGAVYLVAKRRPFLPLWLVAAAFMLGKLRFQFPAGAMMLSILVFEVIVPRVRNLSARTRYSRSAPLVVVMVIVLIVSSVGVSFAASGLNSHHDSTTQPAFMDDDDMATMEWVQENTASGSEFVVLGDAAEWFPLMTDRPILVGPWGVEWEGHDNYRHHLGLYKRMSRCPGKACLTKKMIGNDVDPNYIYVPKGHYTVRGIDEYQKPWMRGHLVDSDRYHLVYENEGAMVFRVDEPMKPVEVPEHGPQPV